MFLIANSRVGPSALRPLYLRAIIRKRVKFKLFAKHMRTLCTSQLGFLTLLFFSFNEFSNNEVYRVAVVVEAFLATSLSKNSLASSLIVTQMRGILLCYVLRFFKDFNTTEIDINLLIMEGP